jgi:drug/metabolite transporter (DMT)-like permease
MQASEHRPAWKTLLCFAIIYLVWGTTFLAIRVGVHEIPPFLMAAMRFLVAGGVLYGWMIMQGESSPTGREWISAGAISIFIFVLDYGLLFWAEQRVPSGIAAVMLAMIPLFMALAEIIFLGTQKLTGRLALALLSGSPVDKRGALALLVGSMSWSLGSVLTRKMTLPSSKGMSSGAQMLAGGFFLALTSAALGEFRGFHPLAVSREAWFALLYLIVAGSIIGFTAYVWLIHHESPTKVATYAYVNPCVAVFVGYFLGGEALGMRTIIGTLFVLTSVIVITSTKSPRAAAPLSVGNPAKAEGS